MPGHDPHLIKATRANSLFELRARSALTSNVKLEELSLNAEFSCAPYVSRFRLGSLSVSVSRCGTVGGVGQCAPCN